MQTEFLFLIITFFLATLLVPSQSFTTTTTTRTSSRYSRRLILNVASNNICHYDDFSDASSTCVAEGTCVVLEEEDVSILKSLRNRQQSLSFGIGKRYIVRRRGNVHYVPSHPKDDFNIVSQLEEGQIVTATGPSRGFWIPHDGGGWTLTRLQGGTTCLEPIDE